jgi:hypothetical protein
MDWPQNKHAGSPNSVEENPTLENVPPLTGKAVILAVAAFGPNPLMLVGPVNGPLAAPWALAKMLADAAPGAVDARMRDPRLPGQGARQQADRGRTRYLAGHRQQILLRDVEECCDEVLILKDGNIAAFCNLEEERRANRRFLEVETRGGVNGAFAEAVELTTDSSEL